MPKAKTTPNTTNAAAGKKPNKSAKKAARPASTSEGTLRRSSRHGGQPDADPAPTEKANKNKKGKPATLSSKNPLMNAFF